VDAGETQIVASPTFLLAFPLSPSLLVGGQFATSSFLSAEAMLG
jgi:hypothetical protein